MMWNQPRSSKLFPKNLCEIDFAVARKETKKKKVTLKGQDPNKIIGCITKYDVSAVYILRNSTEKYPRNVKGNVALLTVLSDERPLIYNFPSHDATSDQHGIVTADGTLAKQYE